MERYSGEAPSYMTPELLASMLGAFSPEIIAKLEESGGNSPRQREMHGFLLLVYRNVERGHHGDDRHSIFSQGL